MKITVSIPDKLFAAVDHYVKQYVFSRFFEKHPADYITDQLNKVYPGDSSEVGQGLVNMQMNAMEKEEW